MFLRIAQGLFVGGEWSGAMTIVVENAPLHRRARYAALPQIGSPIGTILSSGGFFLMTVFLSKANFDAWGWRLPFLAAIPMLLVALYIRSRLDESPVFKELMEKGETEKAPIRTTLKESWKQIIIGMAAGMLGIGGFYLVTAFVVWYGVNVLEYERSLMLLGGIIAAVVEIPVLILGGRLGERFGSSKVITYGGIFSAIIAWPSFLLIESGNDVLVILGMTLAVAALSLPYAASGTVLTGLFPAKTRYTGVGFAQNTAGMISGFIPLAATALVAARVQPLVAGRRDAGLPLAVHRGRGRHRPEAQRRPARLQALANLRCAPREPPSPAVHTGRPSHFFTLHRKGPRPPMTTVSRPPHRQNPRSPRRGPRLCGAG